MMIVFRLANVEYSWGEDAFYYVVVIDRSIEVQGSSFVISQHASFALVVGLRRIM